MTDRPGRADGQRQRDPVHHRHLDVGEQEVERAFRCLHGFGRKAAILAFGHLVPGKAEGPGDERANIVVVFGEKDARHQCVVSKGSAERAIGVSVRARPLVKVRRTVLGAFGRIA